MMPGKSFKYVAFYDLDHTILMDNSATHLINEARRKGLMSEKHFRQAIYLSILYKMGIGNSTQMIIRMLSWLRGLGEDVIRKLCVDVFNKKIVQKIRPEILTSMEEHRSKNAAIVLLSSASGPICDPVSGYLKLDDVICSRLEISDGIFTGNIIGKLVYGTEKKNRLISYCSDHGYDPAEAYYYGDSYTDHFVMAVVGHPIAVDPDKRLCKIALANDWPILIRNRA
jgi:HAD superfamily hydrolase (TIGR01490 family)